MYPCNIVWNVSRVCSFSCTFCCLASEQSNSKNNELSFEQKIQVVDQLSGGPYCVDFSGGDNLLAPENIELIRYAVKKIGQSKISVTLPGAYVDDNLTKILLNVSSVEISLDIPPEYPDPERPFRQNYHAFQAIKKLSGAGVSVEVQTVLRRDNSNTACLDALYSVIMAHRVKKWSILRLLCIGKAKGLHSIFPTKDQIGKALIYLKQKEANGGPEIHFQHLFYEFLKENISCRAVRRSVGIDDDGTVVACFWARELSGVPLNDVILGKLPADDIVSIMDSCKANIWRQKAIQCKACPVNTENSFGIVGAS